MVHAIARSGGKANLQSVPGAKMLYIMLYPVIIIITVIISLYAVRVAVQSISSTPH